MNIGVFRQGSLGDLLVAIPGLRYLRNRYPDATFMFIGNQPFGETREKQVEAEAVFDHQGLLDEFYYYDPHARFGGMTGIMSVIKEKKIDTVAYLARPGGWATHLRDYFFFKAVGVRNLLGLKPKRADFDYRKDPVTGLMEREGERLVRVLSGSAPSLIQETRAFQFQIPFEAVIGWRARIAEASFPARYVVASLGAKIPVKDWGDRNWHQWARAFGAGHGEVGLVMIGSSDEAERSQKLLDRWAGPTMNLCGELSVAESAAVLEKGLFFVGHDSGPMHLAASVGKRCVAIFSSRNRAGIWFPFGEGHELHYTSVPCAGCNLKVCVEKQKVCILSISVESVARSCNKVLRDVSVGPSAGGN